MEFRILYIIVSIISTYNIFRLNRLFLGYPSVSKKCFFVSYGIFYILDIIFGIYIRFAILTAITKILSLLFLSLIYDSAWKSKIFTVCSIYLFLLTTETVVVFLTGYIRHSPFGYSQYQALDGIVYIPFIQIICILLMEQYTNFSHKENISWPHFFCLIAVPSFSACFTLFTIDTFSKINVSLKYVISFLIFIIVINYILFYFYDNIIKAEQYKAKINIMRIEHAHYLNEISILNALNTSTKKVQHDIQNHIIALQGFLKNEQKNDALNYLDKMNDEIKTEFVVTGRTEIDSLMNYKMFEATKSGIQIFSEFFIPVELAVESLDIVTILGNLLDNAIKGVRNLPIEDKKIYLSVVYDRGCLVIEEYNKYQEIRYDKLGHPKSTKKDVENHGRGLKNIYETVLKYHGDVAYSVNESFVFNIFIIMYINQ